mgnify:CR=1 FL=1
MSAVAHAVAEGVVVVDLARRVGDAGGDAFFVAGTPPQEFQGVTARSQTVWPEDWLCSQLAQHAPKLPVAEYSESGSSSPVAGVAFDMRCDVPG